MKLGICIVPFRVTYGECREARLAEEASGIKLPRSSFPHRGILPTPSPDSRGGVI